MDFKTYLGRSIKCSCGKEHRCDIEDIIVEANAVNRVPELLKKGDYHKISIVEDENTKLVLGDRVKDIVSGAGYEVETVVLPGEHLLPDETGIGSVLTGISIDSEMILAVGSGTINDLVKFVSYKMGIPYIIIGTAASMDGFASNVAAMVTKKSKVTYEAHMPKAIIADVRIMAEAPLDLISAGVGDVLGKYICLTDWKLSSLLTGEYYCEYVAELVKESVEKVYHAAQALKDSRDELCITELVEGLILSGICMSYIGNSRPASGSEHHLSHFWEMFFLQKGEHGAYHGTKVGVGTIMCLKMYEWLLQENFGEVTAEPYIYNQDKWEGEMRRIYKTAADNVIGLERQIQKNSVGNRNNRMNRLLEKEKEVRELLAQLPKAEELMNVMRDIEAPISPKEIDVNNDQLVQSCCYAKELRNRTGLLQILHDLGLAEKYAQRLLSEFYK